MILGIKTRKELNEEIVDYKGRLCESNQQLIALWEKKNLYEKILNRLIFENTTTTIPEGAQLLVLKEFNLVGKTEEVIEILEGVKEETDTPKYNATLYCSEDTPYMYLSKKLTEGYKYLAVKFTDGEIQFYLNNDGEGIEIDSNNRVRNKLVLQVLQGLYGFVDGKNSLFFEKK